MFRPRRNCHRHPAPSGNVFPSLQSPCSKTRCVCGGRECVAQVCFRRIGSVVQGIRFVIGKHPFEYRCCTVAKKQRHTGCHSLSLVELLQRVRNPLTQPLRLKRALQWILTFSSHMLKPCCKFTVKLFCKFTTRSTTVLLNS